MYFISLINHFECIHYDFVMKTDHTIFVFVAWKQQNSDASNGRWRKRVIHSVVEIAHEMSPEHTRSRTNSLLSSLKHNVIKQTGMTARLLTSSLFSGKSTANRMITTVPSQKSKSIQNTPEKSSVKLPYASLRKVFFSGLFVASMLVK